MGDDGRHEKGPESTEREEEEEEEEEEEVLSGSSSDEGDEDEDEEEDEEEEEQPRKKSSKHDKSRKSSSSSKRKSQSDRRSRSKDGGKRKKRRGVTAFLDVEAQEGDDEEEEDADDFLDYSDEAAQAARLAAQAAEARRAGGRDDRGGASQQRRGGAGHLENAIDSLARRYQDQTFEEGEEEEDDLLEDADGYPYEDGNEGNLLPDITDPKLWMVKLNKMGVEREVCISILNKCFQQQERGRDPEIYSCYASDDLKGYVYVEAHSQYAIKEALQGLRLVRTYGDIKIVPLQEMPAVFNSVRSQAPYIPQRNDFVRIKRGMYANDIAQIHQVEEQGMIVTVRLIPRLDLNALLDREKHGGDFGRKGEMTLLKRMGGVRPQKRFFDRDEIDARGGQVEQGVQPGTVRFAGMTFEESGYLLRRIAVRHLLVGSTASPSLAEVTEFVQGQQDKEGDDLQEIRRPLSSFLKRQRSAYRLGERVRVIKGELQGMRGKIGERRQDPEEDDEEESVEVVLEHKKLGAVMLKTSHLVKDLQVGENVRAVGGVNAGHSGLITSIDFNRQTATVFSPAAGLEFSCGLESLTVAPDSGLGEEGLSSVRGFHLGDFVELTGGEKGVLVFIDKNQSSIRLLLPSNSCLSATAAQLASKRSTDLLTAVDEMRNTIEKGASVVITKQQGVLAPVSSLSSSSYGTSTAGATLAGLLGISMNSLGSGEGGGSGLLPFGGLKGSNGKVLHVWRDRVFLKVTGRRENAGIVAVDAKHVRLAGTSLQSRRGGFGPQDAFSLNAAFGGGRGRGLAIRGGGLGRGRGGGVLGGRGWGMRRNPYIGKLVKIMKGRYRGLTATVRRVEQTELHVLLQMKEQELKVAKTDVQLVESCQDYQSLVGRLASAPPPTSLGGAGGSSLGGGGDVSYLDRHLRTPDVGGGRDEMSSYLGSSLDSAFLNTVSSPYGGDGGSGVPQSPGFGSSSAGSSAPTFSRSLTPISSSSAFIPPSLASLSGNGGGGAGLGDRSSGASTCFFDPSGVGIAGSVVRRGSLSSSLRDDPTASNTDGLLTPGDDDPTSNSAMSVSLSNMSISNSSSRPGGEGGGRLGEGRRAPDWCCPGVEVCVVAGSGGYRGRVGVIGQVLPQDDQLLCHVYIGDDDLIAIAAESLTPVIPTEPSRTKRVMILDRDCPQFGRTGFWIQAINPSCGVVQTDHAGEVMCDPKLLVNYDPPPEAED